MKGKKATSPAYGVASGRVMGECAGRELTETVPFTAKYMQFEVSQEVS